jgi:flagellar hook-associated protein 1 FlgK
MRSTFGGFDIARKALIAQQQALNVTGHNIANAATPGYSRQRAVLTASAPYTIPSMHSPTSAGQVGTGVEITSIYRLRDQYTDYQYRTENQSLGNWEAQSEMLDRVEGVFAEPSQSGLGSAIAEFFDSWQDLSRDAGSDTARAVVRQRGVAVADMFRHIYTQLDDARVDLNEGIRLAVADINSLADQIAGLNGQIQSSELHGYRANDLRDQRDLLVDDLSKLININVFEQDGQFAIVVNGNSLVRHQTRSHLQLALGESSPGVHELVWANPDGTAGGTVNATNGRLAGLITSRDKLQNNYMAALDDLANQFASQVNNIHRSGYYLADPDTNTWVQGEDFFVPSVGSQIGAKTISLHPGITDTPEGRRMIAAAGADNQVTGDGTVALEMAQMRNQVLPQLNGTVEDRFQGMLGVLGVDSQLAQRYSQNQTSLVEQLQARRDSVSSVSLDEELTNMIRYQQSYNAAARLVTTMDEMIDILINRTGVR